MEDGCFSNPPVPEQIHPDSVTTTDQADYYIGLLQEYIGYRIGYWDGLTPTKHYIDALGGIAEFVKYTNEEFDILNKYFKKLRDLKVRKEQLKTGALHV